MIGLFILMVSVFVGYVGFISLRYGILPSISDSYYVLPKKYNILFTLFCWGFAFPALVIGLDVTNNFLMFLAGSGIVFVGTAAAFKQKLTKLVHFAGAYSGVFFSQLAIAFEFKLYYLNLFFVLASLLILIFKIRNHVWWIEIAAFISICIALGLNL